MKKMAIPPRRGGVNAKHLFVFFVHAIALAARLAADPPQSEGQYTEDTSGYAYAQQD